MESMTQKRKSPDHEASFIFQKEELDFKQQ